MSLATDLLSTGSKYLGSFESPDGSNDDRGGVITRANKMYGLSNEPYCAMWCGLVAKEAKAPEEFQAIWHPYTGTVYDRAKVNGWVWKPTAGRVVKPASVFIIRGKHVGYVLRGYSDGTFQTLEANASNAIRSLRRQWSDGWECITYPDLGLASENASATGYGWDDIKVKPKRYGGWATPQQRDRVLKQFVEAHPGWWTRKIQIAKPSKYAFEAGEPGTFGKTWQYGPWMESAGGKATRDEQLVKWKRSHHIQVRVWRKVFPAGKPDPVIGGIGNTQ